LVDLIVFDQQDLVPLAADPALKFFKDELLTDDNLLSAVLIPVCTGLALLFRIKNDGELGWLEWSIDELQTSVDMKLLVVVHRGFFHEFLLL
jgi:hypothetical protein